MQVILLAAGKSTRLQPIGDKNLLEFSGKPLIEHQIATLKKAKLRDIVVVVNAENMEPIQKILSHYKDIVVVEQKEMAESQAGGVLAGAKFIRQKNVLVMSTNDVFDDCLFEEMIQASKKRGVDGVIAGKKMIKYFPGGYLKLDKQHYITDIIEKPGEGKEPSQLVNLICHVYNDFPAFVKYQKSAQTKKNDHYEMALDNYIKKGNAQILAHQYTGSWHAIKYPWHILELMNHFLANQKTKIDKSAQIEKSAVVEGNVVIEKNVKIMHNAVIKGPAYIGENSIIANNSLIRGSMIGRNSVIGYTTEVARSYLNREVWTHTNYLGDSIIDHNVSFGAGTVLGNLRFDEANIKMKIKDERLDTGTNKFGAVIGSGARFGINSSTNPGVKIGQNSFIGGGVLVEKDVENESLVLLDQKLKISKNSKSASVKNRNK